MQVPGILEKTTIRTKNTLLIYVSAFFFMFGYTILAYSIAYFMMERLSWHPNPIFFVGVILGCASFFGIFIDSFWAYLQKVKSPKTLTICALIGMIITTAIFLLSNLNFGGIFSILRWTTFTFVAAFIYGWSFDLYDVTVSNTILKRSKKENLAQNISQKKVAEALGMVAGLIIAGLLSVFNSPILTQMILIIFFIFVTFFFITYFDRKEDKEEKLEFSEHALLDWKHVFSNISDTDKIQSVAQNLPKQLQTSVTTLAHKTATAIKNLPSGTAHLSGEILEKARWELIALLSKEGEIIKKGSSKEKFNFKEMFYEVKETFGDFFSIFGKNFKMPLIWSALCVMIFSFWDTMAITYQPLLLKELAGTSQLLQAMSGFLIVIFVIPVFVFQIPFSILADKIGRHIMMLLGLFLSGAAVLVISTTGDISNAGNLIKLIIAGMISGAGYAAAFSPAQAMFVDEFKKIKTKTVKVDNDSESGAASLRVSLNFGNIFGQIFGGALFALLGFKGGFMMFGFLFLAYFIISAILYFKIRPQKEDATQSGAPIQPKPAPQPAQTQTTPPVKNEIKDVTEDIEVTETIEEMLE